ncbi:unnamed protein product [Cylicocyclus nassatus]|uniref:Uncharacterized protein n=1 Tax=Cylicocyclus nassatus TaxID=53992 RepID=A0AA36GNG4_CYLNA|nr:unnamed protein product [Cylicocyclus nassatus]
MMENTRAIPFVPISIYITGTMLNFFLLYVYWHWYWHVDSLWSSAVKIRFGQIVRNANNRSRRDKPMRPRESIEEPQELTVEKLMHLSENSWSDTDAPEDSVTNDVTNSRRLQKQETNVSLIFQEAEAARANGEVLKDRLKRPAVGEEKASNVLELPLTSKTVRARYPHEPPVIKALMKRGKDEIVAKQLDGAVKRAMYRRRSTREVSIDQDDQPTSARPRVTISNLQTVSIYEEDKESDEEPNADISSSVKTKTTEQNNQKKAKRTKKSTPRKSAISPRAARALAKRQATKPKPPAKLPNGSVPNNSKTRFMGRQSTESINPIAEPMPQETVASALSTPSPPPPPPIVATRLAPDAVENLVLKAQEELRTGRTKEFAAEERRPRRILPRTPDENPSGEIPRAKFYLQNSHL